MDVADFPEVLFEKIRLDFPDVCRILKFRIQVVFRLEKNSVFAIVVDDDPSAVEKRAPKDIS